MFPLNELIEQQLEKLETRFAFQDQEIQTLNDVIIRQQAQIDGLAEQLRILQDKMKDMNPDLVIPGSEEKPPPHY